MISVIHRPSEIETGIFSLIRSITEASRKKLLPKSKREIVPHHLDEAFMRRLVEAELLFQLGLMNSGSRPCAPRYQFPLAIRAALASSYHQVSTMPRSYFGLMVGRPNLSQWAIQ
jgi:hypothetical protein